MEDRNSARLQPAQISYEIIYKSSPSSTRILPPGNLVPRGALTYTWCSSLPQNQSRKAVRNFFPERTSITKTWRRITDHQTRWWNRRPEAVNRLYSELPIAKLTAPNKYPIKWRIAPVLLLGLHYLERDTLKQEKLAQMRKYTKINEEQSEQHLFNKAVKQWTIDELH